MTLSVQPVAILSDNYAWLLQDAGSGATAIVDPAEDAPIERAIQHAGGRLDAILLTHHHGDHIAAADLFRDRYGAMVFGAAADAHRLPRLDLALGDGDAVPFAGQQARVIATPGHTRGHVSYYFADPPMLFCGDTLFSLGCGRLLEGSAAELFASLGRFADLPDATLICCGHEYTQSNARFARAVDPDNPALLARIADVERLRAAGRPSLPAVLGAERAANPFLRAPDAASFAALRARKDGF